MVIKKDYYLLLSKQLKKKLSDAMKELMDMLRRVILDVKTFEVFFIVFYIVATSYSYR